ncbi:hypothetical protein EBX31_00200 [bacterium]|nr:hypothetical protein [bacterium]
MNLPRGNRLTGLRWGRWARLRHDLPEEIRRDEALVSGYLCDQGPCAIGKIGTTEMMVLEYWDRWIRPPWPRNASWWRPTQRLHHTAGFFPVEKNAILQWLPLYREALHALDLVPAWQTPGTYLSAYENRALSRYVPQAGRISLSALHPVHPPASWLPNLCSLRWLVITPFEASIRAQLPHLEKLGFFPGECRPLLPQVRAHCRILRCPQLPYLERPRHRTWFETLEELKTQMEREDFDVALVGAGAWSVPLVAHAKRLGKKGLHFGGQLQLLFGIKGGRWDHAGIYNEFWIRPLPQERPEDFLKMENGAYW